MHYGLKALREICTYQTSMKLLMPKIAFACLIREVTQDFEVDLRFQPEALLALQESVQKLIW